MTGTESGEAGQAVARVQSFLVERIAWYLELPADRIAPDIPVWEYGLGSVHAAALCGEIEDDLGIPVDPALLWDAETITDIVACLAEEMRARRGVSG